MRMLLLDKVISLEGQKISARKTVNLNEDIFEYHFPENPVMPAAFMTEAALQLARVFCWHKTDFKMTLMPIEYKKLTFYKGIEPDQTLMLHVSFLQNEDMFSLLENVDFHVVGTHNEIKVFEGKIKCKYVSFNDLHDQIYCRRFYNYILKEFLNE